MVFPAEVDEEQGDENGSVRGALIHSRQLSPPRLQASPRPLHHSFGSRSVAGIGSTTAGSLALPGQIEAIGVDCVSYTTSPDVEDWGNFLLASHLALQLLVKAEDGPFTEAVDISRTSTSGNEGLWLVGV